MNKPIIILLFILFTPLSAMSFPGSDPVPGGVAIINLGKHYTPGTKVYFNKSRVMVKQNADTSGNKWLAVVGLPLKLKEGRHKLKLVSGKNTSYVEFNVGNKEYTTRHITIKNKRMVSPTKKDIERHYRERPLMLKALRTWTESDSVETQFIIPVDGPFSSPFGLKRIYNNQKRIRRHTGLDIAAPTGTLIRSPAKGRVIRTGNYFFTGGTVFIDHGQGLVTMYCHMNRIDVKAGQTLKQNQAIGTVGKTGRVSGAHLHWVVSLNNTKVDPKLFIPTQK